MSRQSLETDSFYFNVCIFFHSKKSHTNILLRLDLEQSGRKIFQQFSLALGLLKKHEKIEKKIDFAETYYMTAAGGRKFAFVGEHIYDLWYLHH